jgi:hypothetical protein
MVICHFLEEHHMVSRGRERIRKIKCFLNTRKYEIICLYSREEDILADASQEISVDTKRQIMKHINE